ncbi:MAG: 23S rRNA (guanosine(2251)-2'-O)-methyltransferase RlmB [Acidobacteria bacterium]|nr:23S rRNA (guanosine(2251)-2'-O)-methyltransferase RlmB [Acidobacteriota bacterium]NIM62986.1 23S rRNA (guanosine(2251)-2'-O)-methyltransferase RlmB [Acidobacteriota bacterium]NIO58360.1 23S rRNA (guanosine(2251)-2'-O)-methyltransferase RlmB [Acidobacteriota bacterium]NIQ29411.1 23S rRNA (guanosine(2251)-2'-O)-methyltransferase RlmB [Acidobacteriota bacterium]NIQ84034.1 23S rRNA (guanosine(2251)-2'-O)-methyltransferase RlmB [Acidobacteriota bacterium]
MRRDRSAGEEDRTVYGVHPVLELVEKKPHEVVRIWVAREDDRKLGRLLRTARQAGIPVSRLPRNALTRRLPRGVNHQGVAALSAASPYVPLEQVERAAEGGARLLILVDGVQDPGNLGAILRTSAAAGVDGVVLASEGTAGLTPAAVRASAGTATGLAVARTAKPGRFIRKMAEKGFRTVALDPHGEVSWDAAPLDGPLILVAGGEERGLRPSVLQECNQTVAIPLAEGIDSLNVAVATGVLLFEAVRRRRRP